MFKIMSSEEHGKLIEDIDYWKTLALKEEKRKKLYQNLYESQKSKVFKLTAENRSLDRKLEDIEKGINNEHQCNQYCFKEHVLSAIQRDYDYRSIQFKNDWQKRHYFIQLWEQKLKNEYDFLESLYMISDTIMVAFKA